MASTETWPALSGVDGVVGTSFAGQSPLHQALVPLWSGASEEAIQWSSKDSVKRMGSFSWIR